MKGITFPDDLASAQGFLQELIRRSVDGTVSPLFVDYNNQKVLIRETTASAADSLIEFLKGGRITTGGVWHILSSANLYSDVNVTGQFRSTNATGGFNGLFYTWPAGNGVAGTVLVNNGSGVLSWSAESSGGAVVSAFNNLTATALKVDGTISSTGAVSFLGITNIRNNMTASALQIEATAPGTPVKSTLYSDSIIKGWAAINGVSTPASLYDSLNVSSLTDGGVGDYTLNWALAFAAANNYSVAAMGTFGNGTIGSQGTKSTTACQIRMFDHTGSIADVDPATAIAIGDQ